MRIRRLLLIAGAGVVVAGALWIVIAAWLVWLVERDHSRPRV
jgi:hypothetical protein